MNRRLFSELFSEPYPFLFFTARNTSKLFLISIFQTFLNFFSELFSEPVSPTSPGYLVSGQWCDLE